MTHVSSWLDYTSLTFLVMLKVWRVPQTEYRIAQYTQFSRKISDQITYFNLRKHPDNQKMSSNVRFTNVKKLNEIFYGRSLTDSTNWKIFFHVTWEWRGSGYSSIVFRIQNAHKDYLKALACGKLDSPSQGQSLFYEKKKTKLLYASLDNNVMGL